MDSNESSTSLPASSIRYPNHYAASNGINDVVVSSTTTKQQLHRCACCPYGFHIDLDFVKFAEDVASGREYLEPLSTVF